MADRGRILFLCPDVPHATGGVTKIYEFASALNNQGHNVAIVHNDPKYRPCWFDSDVHVVGRKNTIVFQNDLLVIPEFMSTLLPKLKGCAKVILNQGSFAPGAVWFQDDQCCSIVTTSQYIYRYVRFCHPNSRSFLIQLGYDRELFNPINSIRKRQIAFMPRRRGEDSKRIIQALERRGVLNSWSLVRIDGLPTYEVARVLRESMMFLSFSQREGFGLPPLEAMACGCLVVGFHGHGGAEFFNSDYCYPIPEDDICLYQETVECLLTDSQIETICKVKGEAAAKALSEKYTMERQNNDVVEIFGLSLKLAQDIKGLTPVSLGKIKYERGVISHAASDLKMAFKRLAGL